MRNILLLNQKRFALNLTWAKSEKGHRAEENAALLKAYYGVFLKRKQMAGFAEKSQKGAYTLAGFLALKLKRGIFITDKIKQDSQLGQRFWVCAFDKKLPLPYVMGDNHARLTADSIISQTALKQFLVGFSADEDNKTAKKIAAQTTKKSRILRFFQKKKVQQISPQTALPLLVDVTDGLLEQLGVSTSTSVDLKAMTNTHIASRFKVKYLKKTVAKILAILCGAVAVIWAANAGFEWWVSQQSVIPVKTTIEIPKIDESDKLLSEIQKTNAHHYLSAVTEQLKRIPLTAKGWNIEAVEYVFLLPNQLRLMYQVGLGGNIESAKNLVNLIDDGTGSIEITFFDQNKKCDIILPLTAFKHHALPSKKTIRGAIKPEKGFAFMSQVQTRNINYQLGRKTPVSLGDHREHFIQEIHFGALKPINLAEIAYIAKNFDNFVLKELKGTFDQNFTLGWQLTGAYYA